MNTCSQSPENDLASERLAQWLQASARGDMAAFRALHDATRTRLLALAMEVLPHASRAEEVLQDAYVKVWRAASQFDASIARPMTWLMRIVRNTAIDQLRARQTEARHTVALDDELAQQVQEQLADPGMNPEEHCEAQQLAMHMQRDLAMLPAKQRQAVAMVLCQGHSAQEAAQRQGLRLPQLRGRLRAGSEQLANWASCY